MYEVDVRVRDRASLYRDKAGHFQLTLKLAIRLFDIALEDAKVPQQIVQSIVISQA
jgi:hypothetical protein